MTELRILNLIVWGVMLAYMTPGAWCATSTRARYGDPMRLACALTAIVFIAFNLYWIFGPRAHAAPTDPLMNALLLLSAALGGFILKLGTTYGRGQRLHKEADDVG